MSAQGPSGVATLGAAVTERLRQFRLTGDNAALPLSGSLRTIRGIRIECRADNNGRPPCGPQEAEGLGGDLVVEPGYPNPFNENTKITYRLPGAAIVRLAIYDVSGREVKVLVESRQGPGEFSATWDGRKRSAAPASSGVYFYRLTAGVATTVGRIILAR